MKNITYEEVNNSFKTEYKKEFGKVFKAFSYQIFWDEMLILYKLLKGINNKENDLKTEIRFKEILGIE